ncbi:interferon alpha/beta receptor 1a isoform X1 [Oncorhynchus kisutch]|uniref:interferon alpha/beta receptor 1a isoform X1 n=1 Tax=Oncorhynchus kisutch TaxID=8019 RepID=UPI0009A08787|nr:interferon alpha/beta receptor 1a isoform X1 [Oncorhynchus kisutch]
MSWFPFLSQHPVLHVSKLSRLGKVFAALPRPYNVRMDAVNTRYIMKWDWNHSMANHNITFTAQYTFSHKQSDGRSYTGMCIRITEARCDFSRELNFYMGSYILRVRAEGRGQMSDWYMLKFVPDEHADLGPPSHVAFDPGDTMLTVSFREPMTEQNTPMRSVLDMSFSLQYWEKHSPSKKQEKVFDSTEGTLFPLKPWTEYCLQVNAFNKLYNKTSPYTQQQCVRTLGYPPVWKVLLPLLGCVALMTTVPVYRCHKKRKSIVSKHTFPSSILHNTQDTISLLLLPREESCVATVVVAVQVEQTSQGQQQQVKGQGDVEAEQDSGSSSIQRGQGSSSQDSGIYSGEDSGKKSAGSTTTSQPKETH